MHENIPLTSQTLAMTALNTIVDENSEDVVASEMKDSATVPRPRPPMPTHRSRAAKIESDSKRAEFQICFSDGVRAVQGNSQ